MAESASLISGVAKALHRASWAQIVLAVSGLLVARWVLRGIYRIYFHPLRAFPGPKFSAFTRLPKLTAAWFGNLNPYTEALHAQYGEVVRVAPDELSFIHPDAWRDIYGHGHGQGKGAQGSVPPKDWSFYSPPSNGVPNIISIDDPQKHAHMRKIFKPAFSDRALKEQEPLIVKYVDQLVGNLKDAVSEEPAKKFDMVSNYNFTTFDIMGDLAFGESLHLLDNSQYNSWVATIFGSIKYGSRFGLMRHYPLLARTVRALLPPSFEKKKYEHFQYSSDRVSKRLDSGRATEGSDLWSRVLDQDEGKALSRGQMDSMGSFFMIAGTETTATLLSGLTFYLLKSPEKLAKLTNEVRSAFTHPSDMKMEALAALPYLNACMKEALRVYPPVPTALPHMTPSNGSTICGQFIPPGTIVAAPQYIMYSSERNFKDPLSFVPERWMGDERYANDRKAALQPFSVGSRDCAGKNLSYHEMRLIISRVLFQFDLELCPESDNWADQKMFSLWEKHPLMVRLKDIRA